MGDYRGAVNEIPVWERGCWNESGGRTDA